MPLGFVRAGHVLGHVAVLLLGFELWWTLFALAEHVLHGDLPGLQPERRYVHGQRYDVHERYDLLDRRAGHVSVHADVRPVRMRG